MYLEWIHSDGAATAALCVKILKIAAPLSVGKSLVICQAENLLTSLKSEKVP
jgi:hypothetical protein